MRCSSCAEVFPHYMIVKLQDKEYCIKCAIITIDSRLRYIEEIKD